MHAYMDSTEILQDGLTSWRVVGNLPYAHARSSAVNFNNKILLFGKYLLPNTGCPTKNDTLFWRAVAPLNFELGIKVGGVLESSGSQLFKTVPTFDF